MELFNQLIETTTQVIKNLYNADVDINSIVINETSKDFEGDYSIVCFSLTHHSKKSPEETAKAIGKELQSKLSVVKSYNAVKGFLNLVIDHSYWVDLVNNNYNNPDFTAFPTKNQKVMVEYSSPNTNKPLHLGHIRNNLLGYAVSEILKANGYDVIKSNLVNDRGVHICKSMLAWQKFSNGETPESTGTKGDKLVGDYYVRFDQELKKQIEEFKQKGKSEEEAEKVAPLMKEVQEMLVKWENNDSKIRELWKKMNQWVYDGFDVTYKKMGVDFDKFYYESDTYLLGKAIIDEGLEKGIFKRKEDNSVWINLTDDGLDEKLLLRADGTSVYITQDIGTAELKYKDYHMDKSIYVVGNEQEYHFKVLKLILQKLDKPYADGVYHLSYGMIELPGGKMKSREGTVVDADDLLDEMIDRAEKQTKEAGKVDDFTEEEAKELYRKIGLAALKFHLLKVDPKKGMLFDPEESIDFLGHTGPFIQYTFARIQSILRKWKEQNGKEDAVSSYANLQPQEKNVLLIIHKYKQVIDEAAAGYDPSVVTNYVYDLAKTYNKFYAEVPVLKEPDSNAVTFRIYLSVFTAHIIQKTMNLLGIEMPERM